jgi:hypothetical protein
MNKKYLVRNFLLLPLRLAHGLLYRIYGTDTNGWIANLLIPSLGMPLVEPCKNLQYRNDIGLVNVLLVIADVTMFDQDGKNGSTTAVPFAENKKQCCMF